MAILLFAYAGTAIVAAMLIAAANAFTLCVAIPAWRSHSILAPVAALVLAGFTAPPLGFLILHIQHHMFLLRERFPFAGLLFGILALLALALICAVTWVATILCRAVLQLVPPVLTRHFGLKPPLLLQAALFVGSVCSAAVQLAAFGGLTWLLRTMPILAIPSSIAGVTGSAICLRVLLQLRTPDAFAPKPVPQWITSVFMQPAPSDGPRV